MVLKRAVLIKENSSSWYILKLSWTSSLKFLVVTEKVDLSLIYEANRQSAGDFSLPICLFFNMDS